MCCNWCCLFQSVVIILNPSDRETALCTNSRQIISTVVAFYGDEISRQRFRGFEFALLSLITTLIE
jgi:hypothetical protein